MEKKVRILLLCMLFAFGVAASSAGVCAKTSLNKKKAEIKVGSTLNIKVKGNNKKVKWSSNNKKVATVKSTGRMAITWKIIPLPTDAPIQYVFKPTSTQYWAEIQVRNHRYPIAKLEYLDASGNYVELPRQEYNYFTAASGLGSAGPYTFRATDIYGHQLVDTGIAINSTSTPVNGAANFPY